MKILHVINSMDPSYGGTSQAVRTIIPSLHSHGVTSEVVSTDDPNSDFLNKDSFKVNALGPAKSSWSYTPKLLPWLLDNMSRFDHIIVHGLWQFPGYAALKAFKQRSNHEHQLFVMPHGMLDPYFQRASGRRLKAIRNFFYWKFIEEKIVNSANGLLFTCEEERRLAREPFRPYHPKNEFVVGMGVQDPPAHTEAMNKAFFEKCPKVREASYLLFLSRIHEKKGVDLLLKAYSDVWKSQGSSAHFPKLVIAGPGLDSPYGQAMQKLVLESGLADFVFFPGMLVKDAKWGAFYNCQAFILPSHQENFGIAVVEALACKKPVLISNQVNIWREIEEHGAGMIEHDSLQGTTQLLKRWLGLDSEAKFSMNGRARDVFEKKFAIAEAANRMFKAISTK